MAKTLSKLGDFAQEMNVTIALETHDSFLIGKDVSGVVLMNAISGQVQLAEK